MEHRVYNPDMTGDFRSDYKKWEPYLAYTKNTNEKEKLHNYIQRAFQDGLFPIKVDDKEKNILDIGCGNGVNTIFLATCFPKHAIDAIDRSSAQIEYAQTNNSADNIRYELITLENFRTDKKYNFILASHILQYIDCDLVEFINKSLSLLAAGGEIWFIQQTKKGMAEMIKYQKPYLTSARFKNWKTFEDYKRNILETLKEDKNYQITEDSLDSAFKNINFANPSEEDKLRLEFIFCLEKSFNEQSEEFKKHLSKLNLGHTEKIYHPNKILKIRKIDDEP